MRFQVAERSDTATSPTMRNWFAQGSPKCNQGTAVDMSAESAGAMAMPQRNHLFGKPGAALAPKRLPRRVRVKFARWLRP